MSESLKDYNQTTCKLREDRSRVGVNVFGLDNSGVAGSVSDVSWEAC